MELRNDGGGLGSEHASRTGSKGGVKIQRENLNKVFSLVILSAAIPACLISLHSAFWFLLLIFPPITMIGYLFRKSSVMNAGIVLSIILFFLLNRNFVFNPLNLFYLIGTLFLFIGIWFFGHHILLLDMIEENSRKGPDVKYVTRLEKTTSYKIIGNVALGAVLTFLATVMGMYGSIGRMTAGQIETVLMVIFSSAIFVVVYVIIKTLSAEEER